MSKLQKPYSRTIRSPRPVSRAQYRSPGDWVFRDSRVGPHAAQSACLRARSAPQPSSPNHARRARTLDPSRPMGLYYHLRYHLWVGVRRDSPGTNSTTTERKAFRRGQTGPDGTKGKRGTPSYESEGRRFESCRARYIKCRFAGILGKAKRLTV
jgi:hypothetical protein